MKFNEAISTLKRSKEIGFDLSFSPEVLKECLKNGGDLAELFFERSDSTQVIFEDNKVDKLIDGKDQGVGIRIIFGRQSVYGYTTDSTKTGLMRLAEDLSTSVDSKIAKKGPGLDLVDWQLGRQPNGDIDQYEPEIEPRTISLKDKVEYAKRAHDGAKAELPGARQVTTMFGDRKRSIVIINSDGLISEDVKTYLQTLAQVVGEKDGRVEMAYEVKGGYVGVEFFEETRPEDVGKEAARRVKILLDAKPAPAGTMPVVMSARAGGTMIHEAVGHGLEADLACNGLSVYQNKIGQKVASSLVTVIDDGTMPAKRGSYRFDDEGTPAQKNVLIENGVLKGYMVDRISAMKFDLMATGNGRRESFRHKPIVRMTNTYIAPGKDDPEQILKDTKYGIFVESMGGGQVNTVTGDFVFAVTEGYLIEDGKITHPIRGATLVGNGPKAMSIVDRVGSDLGFSIGTCGKDGQGAPVTDAQPTIRIPEITVGGEVPMSNYWSKTA